MLYFTLLRFFGKEKGKYTVTLKSGGSSISPRIHRKVVLQCKKTLDREFLVDAIFCFVKGQIQSKFHE